MPLRVTLPYIRACVRNVCTNVCALCTWRFRSQSRSRFPLDPDRQLDFKNGRTDVYLLRTNCCTCTCNSDGQLSGSALCELSRSTTPIGRIRLCVGRHLSSQPDSTYFGLSAFFITNSGGVRGNVSTKMVVRWWKRRWDICYFISHISSEFLGSQQK